MFYQLIIGLNIFFGINDFILPGPFISRKYAHDPYSPQINDSNTFNKTSGCKNGNEQLPFAEWKSLRYNFMF